MTAEATRLALVAEHGRLRVRVESCARLARQFRDGLCPARDLDAALEILRGELEFHNHSETTQIRRLLQGPAAWGSLLIDRMLEEHGAEHVAFLQVMSGTTAEVAGRIDDLAEQLEAHWAAEERTFLAPVTLRDEVLRVRTRQDPNA